MYKSQPSRLHNKKKHCFIIQKCSFNKSHAARLNKSTQIVAIHPLGIKLTALLL